MFVLEMLQQCISFFTENDPDELNHFFGGPLEVHDMASPMLTTLLDPDNVADVVAVRLDLSYEQNEAIIDCVVPDQPYRHNRQCMFFSPNPIEDDGPDHPRLLLDNYPHYQQDVDVPAAHELLEGTYDQWLKNKKINPALYLVLKGGMLTDNNLFPSQEEGVFRNTLFINDTEYPAWTKLHGEVADMYAVNVCLRGYAHWCIIDSNKDNMKRLLKAYKKLEKNIGDPQLYCKTAMYAVSVEDLVDEGVTFKYIYQKPGMAIITKTGAAHLVVSEARTWKIARNSLVDLAALRDWATRLTAGRLVQGEKDKLSTIWPTEKKVDWMKNVSKVITACKNRADWPKTWKKGS